MNGKEFTVSEVIDSFGINGHTWLMFILLGLANIFDGYDFMIVNSTNSYLAASFGLIDYSTMTVNSAQMGSLTTWGLLGMVLGGAVGGAMSDRIGRKKMLIIAVIFYGLFTLPQAFSNDLGFFAVWRLIAGFGVGSCIPIVTTCFSETIPSKNRGVFVTFGMAFMVAGWVLAGLIAAPICTSPTSILGDFTGKEILLANGQTYFENWRMCYLIGALPIIYGIVLIFAMHETPHWYANNGQKDKAVEALKEIERKHHSTVNDYDPNLLVVPPKPANAGPNVLFSKKYIVATAAIWCTYFVGQFCVYGMNAWLPTWFKGIGYSPELIPHIIEMASSPRIVRDQIAAPKTDVFTGKEFGADEEEEEENFSLDALYRLIAGRKTEPKEGSYTTYLFNKGLDKILKKVGEETTEVIISAKDGDKANTIYEIGDLMYHVMVLMVQMGITVEDITRELEKRHVVDHKVKQERMQ